ncbi:MAG: hypothetical protein E7282_04675 [Lachnospiraceae bacterium]|nr:hypothetical protein [Lachnospiraceae bacterium]
MTLPREFIEHMKLILGNEADEFFAIYDMPEVHGLRFRNAYAKEQILDKENMGHDLGIEDEVPWSSLSYYYRADARPGLNPLHEMGIYYIQEPSAMGPAALLHPNPGERVLDLCAAPGGKTTELATYLDGKGLLVANEIHPARAKILASNVERMGIANALVLNEDTSKLREVFPAFFHRILVDAPCSGEGMFRKNPEAIAQWSMENVQICAQRQAMILDNAAAMLMPGGTLVYSTCTFAKEENEDTINDFLKSHPEFSIIEEKRFWPHKEKGEGHFMALLQKEGRLSDSQMPSHAGGLDRAKEKIFLAFLEDLFTSDYVDWFLKARDNRGLLSFKDRIYLAPPECPELKGLKVMRAGLELGEFKKDRFEPAHAWALSVLPMQAKRSIVLETEQEALSYLRGEAKTGLELQKQDLGWTVVSYKGFSMGWGKASGNQVKNHYPKGLRR